MNTTSNKTDSKQSLPKTSSFKRRTRKELLRKYREQQDFEIEKVNVSKNDPVISKMKNVLESIK
ncbi:hypothetical protein AAGG74_17795 [Bacillus mexicanus]|uniref:hypothetical protein n=1 Tax=Bacillus mexicanus TaxID=2834415 RepID=UPI003D1DEBC5